MILASRSRILAQSLHKARMKSLNTGQKEKVGKRAMKGKRRVETDKRGRRLRLKEKDDYLWDVYRWWRVRAMHRQCLIPVGKRMAHFPSANVRKCRSRTAFLNIRRYREITGVCHVSIETQCRLVQRLTCGYAMVMFRRPAQMRYFASC